jgi:hypothetical protein
VARTITLVTDFEKTLFYLNYLLKIIDSFCVLHCMKVNSISFRDWSQNEKPHVRDNYKLLNRDIHVTSLTGRTLE